MLFRSLVALTLSTPTNNSLSLLHEFRVQNSLSLPRGHTRAHTNTNLRDRTRNPEAYLCHDRRREPCNGPTTVTTHRALSIFCSGPVYSRQWQVREQDLGYYYQHPSRRRGGVVSWEKRKGDELIRRVFNCCKGPYWCHVEATLSTLRPHTFVPQLTTFFFFRALLHLLTVAVLCRFCLLFLVSSLSSAQD